MKQFPELDGVDAALCVAGDFIILAVAGPGLTGRQK